MGRTLEDVHAAAISDVDFRRPSRIGRDAVVAVESAHEVFARRLGTAWGANTRAALEIEHVATDQTSVDDYLRALPSPAVLAQLRVDRLGGATALVELDLPLALTLVERVLGGPGDAREGPAVRRPTDLEASLVRSELLEAAVAAIDDALHDLAGEPTVLLGVETTPQPLQLAAAGEMLVLLSYRVEVRGELPGQGLITIGYPVAPLLAQLELLSGAAGDEVDADVLAANRAALLGSHVDVRVRLGGTTLGAGALAALTPGDVLRLDHPIERPATLVVDDRPVGTAHLGRRGRRVAVQIATAPADHR
ncbi:hypothetical protein FTX61_18225 [Nitriliruptoraceae bacterium ZYF776]|nr:hypothetical protein [Profundirhabdus halotolerans]